MMPSTMASLGLLYIRILVMTVTFAAILSQVFGQGGDTLLSSIDFFFYSTLLIVAEGVRLSLKGASNGIANNSYVDVNDIDEDSNALLCLTDKPTCCTNKDNQTRAGDWYYPNGALVDTMGKKPPDEFYRDRGDRVVRLKHRQGRFSVTQRGRFRCIVPDSNGVNQTVFVYIGMSMPTELFVTL